MVLAGIIQGELRTGQGLAVVALLHLVKDQGVIVLDARFGLGFLPFDLAFFTGRTIRNTGKGYGVFHLGPFPILCLVRSGAIGQPDIIGVLKDHGCGIRDSGGDGTQVLYAPALIFDLRLHLPGPVLDFLSLLQIAFFVIVRFKEFDRAGKQRCVNQRYGRRIGPEFQRVCQSQCILSIYQVFSRWIQNNRVIQKTGVIHPFT